jgi:hypothetical protein
VRLFKTAVIAPADNYNLTTLAAVKLEYDIQNEDQDVYISSQIPRVSQLIARYCRRVFAEQTYQDSFRTVRGEWGRLGPPYYHFSHGSIRLSHYPVVPGSLSVTRDGSTLTEDSDFKVDEDSGSVLMLTGHGMGLDITYTAGWTLPGQTSSGGVDLPADIEAAAILMLAAAKQAGRLSWNERDPYIRSETVEGVGSISYAQMPLGSPVNAIAGALPTPVLDYLAPYVVPILR